MKQEISLILDDKTRTYNLSHLERLTTGFLSEKLYFSNTKFKIRYLDDINLSDNFFGIYIVSVKGSFNQWLVEQNIFSFIDKKVLDLVRNKKIILVIDNQSEGFNFFYEEFDGYKKIHEVMKNFFIPKNSLLLITGDYNFNYVYEKWCQTHNEVKMFNHITFMSWICIFYNDNRIPDYPLILDSLNNPNVKNFNSLNKSIRRQRVEHIFYLIYNNLLKNNLVSANFTLGKKRYKNFYKNIPSPLYEKVLDLVLPIHIDGDWSEKNPDDFFDHIFNHDIYKNSLLTFVTETEVYNDSLFITEKTFKPIAAGHPFLILGQYGLLEKLQDLGYRTDFSMFSNYSSIKDDSQRFFEVHENLKRWNSLSKDEQIKHILENLDKIHHNQDLLRKNNNFIMENYNKLYNKVLEIKKDYVN